VKIDIPKVLIHLRGRVNREQGGPRSERIAMEVLGRTFTHRRRYEAAQKLARIGARPLSKDGRIEARLPGPLKGWMAVRDLPAPPAETFRDWWRANR
jgi:L-lactate dehydrogenase complex protein LldF